MCKHRSSRRKVPCHLPVPLPKMWAEDLSAGGSGQAHHAGSAGPTLRTPPKRANCLQFLEADLGGMEERQSPRTAAKSEVQEEVILSHGVGCSRSTGLPQDDTKWCLSLPLLIPKTTPLKPVPQVREEGMSAHRGAQALANS